MAVLADACKANEIPVIPITDKIKDCFKLPKTPGAGYSTMLGDRPVIFYDKNVGLWEQRFIVAHELGHILFGHLRNPSAPGNEFEANVFAAVFTALALFDQMSGA